MTPIKEAKDLILMNYVNSTMERLNVIALADFPGKRAKLTDEIFLTHYEWIRQMMSSYSELVRITRSDHIAEMVRPYREDFREEVYRLNERVAKEGIKGVPNFEHSIYADALIKTDGRIDRTKRNETKSRRKKAERKKDTVFFDDDEYYSIVVPDTKRRNRYREIRKIPYYIPRYIPF